MNADNVNDPTLKQALKKLCEAQEWTDLELREQAAFDGQNDQSFEFLASALFPAQLSFLLTLCGRRSRPSKSK